MNKFLERLNAGEIMVADGATGTNLQAMGIKPGTPPEDLVMDDPDTILKLESAFVEAGSDIILTCTFGGTGMRMNETKYAGRAPEVNKRAVELAREAASSRDGVLVAGSMGPTGALMKPFGPLTPEEATRDLRRAGQSTGRRRRGFVADRDHVRLRRNGRGLRGRALGHRPADRGQFLV